MKTIFVVRIFSRSNNECVAEETYYDLDLACTMCLAREEAGHNVVMEMHCSMELFNSLKGNNDEV